MNKTPAYYIEKYLGLAISIAFGFLAYKYWNFWSFIGDVGFFDKLITISTTLFGFLLTILTLIVQSSSPMIQQMKKHGSYSRLILFNKSIVLLSAIVCLLSLVLICAKEKLMALGSNYVINASIANFSLFTWAIVNTFIFVIIFYRLLISESNK